MTTWDVDIEVLGRTAWSLCIQNLLDQRYRASDTLLEAPGLSFLFNVGMDF